MFIKLQIESLFCNEQLIQIVYLCLYEKLVFKLRTTWQGAYSYVKIGKSSAGRDSGRKNGKFKGFKINLAHLGNKNKAKVMDKGKIYSCDQKGKQRPGLEGFCMPRFYSRWDLEIPKGSDRVICMFGKGHSGCCGELLLGERSKRRGQSRSDCFG